MDPGEWSEYSGNLSGTAGDFMRSSQRRFEAGVLFCTKGARPRWCTNGHEVAPAKPVTESWCLALLNIGCILCTKVHTTNGG